MDYRSFLIKLIIFACFNLIGVVLLEQYDQKYDARLAIVLIGFSTLLNIIVFLLAKRFSEKSDDKRYLTLVFYNFILKLFVIIAIPFVYIKTGGEQNGFIIPYVMVYAAFTIFETYYLNKTAVIRR